MERIKARPHITTSNFPAVGAEDKIDISRENISNFRMVEAFKLLLPEGVPLFRLNAFEFDRLGVDPVKFAIQFDARVGLPPDTFLPDSEEESRLMG